MQSINWKNLTKEQQSEMLQRPNQIYLTEIEQKTQDIIKEVKTFGDIANRKFSLQFDQIQLDHFYVPIQEIEDAVNQISEERKEAINFAANQIEIYHRAQLSKKISINSIPGVKCEREARPLQTVGLYIPGGSAPLVSTVLMLGIPAKIAEVGQCILTTPPNKFGKVDPHLLYAANLCGINNIFKIGGAQAIASMAYGTDSIPKVDKIFGPGNAWVTQAKILVSKDPNGATIDLPAGPSEVLIIADQFANPSFLAADLLSQAEHGVDSQVILVTNSIELAIQVEKQIAVQIDKLTRKTIAKAALQNSKTLIVENIEEALNISNCYAPEHLILNVKNAEQYKAKIYAASTVFLGSWTSETLGDYVIGSNHVLPTNGYARKMSGLSLGDFMIHINFQTVNKKGLKSLGNSAKILAEIEGLDGHRNAVEIRLKHLEAQYAKL